MTIPQPILPFCICGDPRCTVPYGFCHCECGNRTTINFQTQRSKNHLKGKPCRYVSGHNKRTMRPQSRLVTIDGDEYQTVPLTRGKEAIVDFVDYGRIAQHFWYAQKTETRSGFYAARTEGHGPDKKTIFMHAEIFGAPRPDHIDGDGLHNWRNNLRAATTAENGWNYHGHSKNTSGYRGVTRKRNKWQASLMVNRVLILSKCFDTKEEAARAVDVAVLEHHGKFARLNFPEVAQ